LLIEACGERQRRAPVGELQHEREQLLSRDTASERDLLDLAVARLAREPAQRRARPRQPLPLDDDVVADEADDDAVGVLVRLLAQLGQRVDPALQERMGSGVERRRPYGGGEPAHELLVTLRVSHAPPPPRPRLWRSS